MSGKTAEAEGGLRIEGDPTALVLFLIRHEPTRPPGRSSPLSMPNCSGAVESKAKLVLDPAAPPPRSRRAAAAASDQAPTAMEGLLIRDEGLWKSGPVLTSTCPPAQGSGD